jgi:gluconokinase
MGVSGTGKTTVAAELADRLGWTFIEGDGLHPQANIEKMSAGIPLDDDDRGPWLEALASLQAFHHADGVSTVLTCSALKRRYRDRLRAATPGLRFVFLDLTQDQARERVAARPAHLFPVSLVASQFAALEDPRQEPGVLPLDATQSLDDLGSAVVRWVRSAAAAANPQSLETRS